MFKPKTFADLCMAMKTRAVVQFDEQGPRMSNLTGVINGITAEDGSGRCWNVTVQPEGTAYGSMGAADPVKVFIRERE